MAARKTRADASPRNAELEAAIVEEPESPDAYLVYGDWLLEQGDPHGELVSVQAARIKQPKSLDLEKRERQLLREHEAKLGRFAEYEHTWSFGFLESVTLDDPTSELYAELFELVPARFLRELDLAIGDRADGRATLDRMAHLGLPPALRKLAVLGTERHMGSLGDLGVLYPRLQRIKELVIRVAEIDLGVVDLPLVETVAFESRPSKTNLRALATARWPKLRSLSLGFYDDALAVEELDAALASLRDLTHLGIADHHVGDALVRLLVADHRPLLAKLRSLDLSRAGLTDAGAKVLLDRASLFEHMDSIDLRENDLSSAPARNVARALDMADVDDQGMRGDDDDRYDEVDE